MIRRRARLLGMVLATIVLYAQDAIAHRNDYLYETLVYLTLEQNEVEAEYWFDYASQPSGSGHFFRHNAALEWGITDRWMADSRVTVGSEQGDGIKFDSARLESRYRFLEEGMLPVDVAASFEINEEREANGSTTVGIEPRLILSKDFEEKLNLTLNLSEEIPVDSGQSAFLTACGSRFNWSDTIQVGSEFQYNFASDSGAVIPQVWFAFSQGITLKAGYAIGIDQDVENVVRVVIEVEF